MLRATIVIDYDPNLDDYGLNDSQFDGDTDAEKLKAAMCLDQDDLESGCLTANSQENFLSVIRYMINHMTDKTVKLEVIGENHYLYSEDLW